MDLEFIIYGKKLILENYIILLYAKTKFDITNIHWWDYWND